MRRTRAFTLIELLVVISIIALLATILITQFSAARTKAKNAQAKSDITAIGTTVAAFRATNPSEGIWRSYATDGDTLTGTTEYNKFSSELFSGTGNFYPTKITSTPDNSYTYTYQTSDPISTHTYANGGVCPGIGICHMLGDGTGTFLAWTTLQTGIHGEGSDVAFYVNGETASSVGDIAQLPPIGGGGSATTKRSDSFVDFIGLNTHFEYPNYNLNAVQSNRAYVVSTVNQLITDLGVRHIREGITSTGSYFYGTTKIDYWGQMKTLSDAGVKFNVIAADFQSSPWPKCSDLSTNAMAVLLQAQCVQGVNVGDAAYSTTELIIPKSNQSDMETGVTAMRGAGISIEGMEADNEYFTYVPSHFAGKTPPEIYPRNWEQVDSLYTEKVYSPAAKNLGLDLIGPSVVPHFGYCPTWPNYQPPIFAPPPSPSCTAPLTPFDDLSSFVSYGNSHVYQSTYWGGPAAFLSGDNVLDWWKALYPGKQMIYTEMGYEDNLFNAMCGAKLCHGFTPTVQSKYMLRMLFELFNAGVKRTYIYELLDEWPMSGMPTTALLGLAGFQADGTIYRKPVYNTLKNTMNLLNDPTGTSFSTSDLGVTIDDPSNGSLHKTVLQDHNKNYYLVVWNELKTMGTDSDATINNVTFSFASPQNVALYRPSAQSTPLATYTSQSSVSLNIPDDIEILKISAP